MDAVPQLQAAISRFAGLAGAATGDEPVPACGGWVVRDLVEHLGAVHRWAAAIVLSGQRLTRPDPLVTGPVADWYAGTGAALLAALAAVSPDEDVPNFSRSDQKASFWPRRQLHETTVHTIDALQALGVEEAQWGLGADLAADGVDEVLQVFFPRLTAGGRRPVVRSRLRLVATDLDRSWVIAPGQGDAGTPVQLHPSLDADEIVTGRAADLYLGLWHRVSRDRLRFEGPDGPALFDGPTTP
ncbi:MAG: maleylpyruvate isomerase family mycothiol-dependent enzyme [Aeromicrobium sp.]